MNIRKKLKLGYRYASLEQLIAKTGKTIFLPFYHTISDRHLAHVSNLYAVKTTSQFEKDLDYLLKHFEPISMDTLRSYVANRKPEKPCFHLSFDDGLKELYTVVAPILLKKGIPATVFINTGFLDNKALFYRYQVSLILEKLGTARSGKKDVASILEVSEEDVHRKILALSHKDRTAIQEIVTVLDIDVADYLRKEEPYLTTTQVHALQEMGFTIGAHSIDHPRFNEIPLAEQKRQIQESVSTIESMSTKKDRYFSFPFSDEGVSLELFRWMYEEVGCSLSFGISGLKEDMYPQHLHRVPFEGTGMEVEDIVKSEYFYYWLKGKINKNKILRS